jgi:hypothetical protein
MRTSKLNIAFALALVSAAAVGCNDTPAPISPTLTPNRSGAAVEAAAANKARPRSIYIAGMQLSSVYVSLTSGYTPFTVVVTNPTTNALYNIYLKGEIQSQNNQAPYPVSAFLAYCPNPNGVIPGTRNCVMENGITGIDAPLPPGPATFILKLQQMQPNGSMKVLDTLTTGVILF